MRVGVGLPATLPGTPGRLVLDWARRADEGPFSSLSVLDRVLYGNYEPLTALAAVAGITRRITLAATIVIAPLRSARLLARQAASLQALSGGRLVLGVGLGAREDDYEATGSDYRTRGRRLTHMLADLRRQWEEGTEPPMAHRPRLLVAGSGGLGMSRMARYADGFVHGGGPPRAFLRSAIEASAAWKDLGRTGEPELWGMAYFAFADARSAGVEYLKNYYAFSGPFAERIAAGLLTSREEVAELLHGYEAAGCTDLILFPAVADIWQLDVLARVLTGGRVEAG